ncbi:hypothetical protein MHH70_12640 [Metasolibacillus sp. FSL H7-0170]|uniref:hypothetical protein n=1 Tax=Metasolibacillus sp. FSL H7-0170 TaxID=2921431 RepID=UPI00315805CE
MAINKDKNTQILITISNEKLAEIDDFQFNNRIKNRTEAIRQLIAKGLEGFKSSQKADK